MAMSWPWEQDRGGHPESVSWLQDPGPRPRRGRAVGTNGMMAERLSGGTTGSAAWGAGPWGPGAASGPTPAGRRAGPAVIGGPGFLPRGSPASVPAGRAAGQHGAGAGPAGPERAGAHAVRAPPVLRPAGARLRGLHALPHAGARAG